MSNDDSSENGGKTVTLSKIVAYGFGILFILTGLATVTQGPGGVLILLGGLFALPVVRRRVTGRTGVSFSRTVVAVMVVVLVIAGGATLPSADDSTQVENGGDSQVEDSNEGEDTSTETQTQQPLTHEIGESFTVGSGDQSIEYRVVDAFFQGTVGSSTLGEEADGIYFVVILDMENVGQESFDISDRHLRAVDDQDREFEADFGASAYADNDPRIDAEGIGYEQLNPGLTITRSVIFDVNPGAEYQLKIEPAGVFSGADAHYIPVGSAESESE